MVSFSFCFCTRNPRMYDYFFLYLILIHIFTTFRPINHNNSITDLTLTITTLQRLFRTMIWKWEDKSPLKLLQWKKKQASQKFQFPIFHHILIVNNRSRRCMEADHINFPQQTMPLWAVLKLPLCSPQRNNNNKQCHSHKQH